VKVAKKTPGIGKTTTAQVVCKELDLNSLELNASDARNKRSLEQAVSECLSSHSMKEYDPKGDNQIVGLYCALPNC